MSSQQNDDDDEHDVPPGRVDLQMQLVSRCSVPSLCVIQTQDTKEFSKASNAETGKRVLALSVVEK